MKRVFCLLGLILSLCFTVTAQSKFSNEQLRLRSEFENFLREEGFMPELDSDGDIKFKKEGDVYLILIDNRDHSPFYVSLAKFFNYNNTYSRQSIASSLDKLNMKKGVKTVLFEKTFSIQCQMYLTSSESFKYVFYKLLKQIDALQDELTDVCTSSGSSGYNGYSSSSGYGSGGTLLVNETFSSSSSAWRTDEGQLSFKNGKMIFKDEGARGYSELYYDLPRNIKNEDFQIDLSMKIAFAPEYSALYFLLGTAWNKGYKFGFGEEDDLIDLTFGTSEKSREYYGYSTEANLIDSINHNYKIIKKGRHVEWYADGKLVVSTNIDLTHDIKLMAFLVPNRHKIEIDSITIKLL